MLAAHVSLTEQPLPTLRELARRALVSGDPQEKTAILLSPAGLSVPLSPATQQALTAQAGELVPAWGRYAQVQIATPSTVAERRLGSDKGRAVMLHAIAHIELSAINLALDALLRFTQMPEEFVRAWYGVAIEEVEHYGLIAARLHALGYQYGDFPVHTSLQDLARRSEGDVLARMALIPRLMEAHGLDVTPGILEKFRQARDTDSVAALEVILRDEVGHVALGDHWFRVVCAERGLPVEDTYRQLIRDYGAPWPKGPLNTEARLQAGFTLAELEQLLVI